MKYCKVLLVNVIYIYAIQGARGEKGDEGTPVSMISLCLKYICMYEKTSLNIFFVDMK